VKAKLNLAERTFTCQDCGLHLDRDMNAAHNLAKLAQHVTQSGWETRNARGADRRTQLAGQVAMKREPSRVDIKTGTDG
jgi:putative transposase